MRLYPESEVCMCGGKGSVSQEEHHHNHGQYTTSLCACRRNLPRRDGKVSWWTYDESKAWEWSDSIGWRHVTVTAKRELPISKDNYPLRRTRANAYMCASVYIEQDGDWFLTVDQVREYARWLLKTADEIEAYDAVKDDKP